MTRFLFLAVLFAVIAVLAARRPRSIEARPYWWIEPGPDGESTYTTLNEPSWTV